MSEETGLIDNNTHTFFDNRVMYSGSTIKPVNLISAGKKKNSVNLTISLIVSIVTVAINHTIFNILTYSKQDKPSNT